MKLSRYVAVTVAALAIGVGGYLTFEPHTAPSPVPQVGYTLLDGSQGHTSQWQGRVVLVNFWATTCSICVHEMPRMIETHERFKARGFDTVAVAMQYDPPASVVHYAQTRRLPFGVAIDNTGEIARSFGSIRGTPTTMVVNKRGEIVKRFVGEPDFVALHRLVDQLLAEG